MPILVTGNTYAANDQVTSTNLNAAVNSATFASGAVDGVVEAQVTLEISGAITETP